MPLKGVLEMLLFTSATLHSAVFAVVRCLSVRPSHAGIVSKLPNLS